jgi:hypothetical protein
MSKLAEKGNWDADFNEEEKPVMDESKKTLYLDTSKPGKYIVRLVGAHVKCRRHFKPYRATVQDDEKNIDPAWLAGFFPSRRFAVNVIDRADNKLKVLEKGVTVFKTFADYKSATGKDPAGIKEGSDFVITVSIPKGNKLNTEYSVISIKETPLTKEEIEMIKAQKLWPLTQIYKSTPAEKMKEMWDALSDSQKIAPKRDNDDGAKTSASTAAPSAPSKPAPVMEEKMESSPANSEDLFAEKDGDKEDTDSTKLF